MVNLNLNFEALNLILSLEENDPEVEEKLQEFEKLKFGRTGYKKFVNNGTGRVPLDDYIADMEAKKVPDEEKRFRDLERRITTLENLFTKRQVKAAPAVETVREKKRSYSAKKMPVYRWHQRLKRGTAKIVKINALLELANLQMIPLSEKGNNLFSSKVQPGMITAAVTVESLFDKYGEEKFMQLINAIGMMEIYVRREHLEAAAYCLFEAANPLTPEAFFVEAADLFKTPWPELLARLNKLPRGDRETTSSVLGKLVMGEVKF